MMSPCSKFWIFNSHCHFHVVIYNSFMIGSDVTYIPLQSLRWGCSKFAHYCWFKYQLHLKDCEPFEDLLVYTHWWAGSSHSFCSQFPHCFLAFLFYCCMKAELPSMSSVPLQPLYTLIEDLALFLNHRVIDDHLPIFFGSTLFQFPKTLVYVSPDRKSSPCHPSQLDQDRQYCEFTSVLVMASLTLLMHFLSFDKLPW